MPTYDDLRSYFDDSDALRTLCSDVSDLSIVEGFTLTLDPVWVLLYDLEDRHGRAHRDPHLLHRLIWHLDEYPDVPISWATYPLHPWYDHPSEPGFRRRDLKREVQEWARFIKEDPNRSSPEPIILTVVHRPLRSPRVSEETSEADAEEVRRLWRIADASPLRVRVEGRPPALLSFSAGEAIKATTNGKLGGLLAPTTRSVHYGVTCAHVASEHDPVTDVAGTSLGTCVAHSHLALLPPGTSCDPASHTYPNPSPGNGPDVNMLDCALVELASPATAQSITGIAAELSPGQTVRLQGPVARRRFTLGALAISYKFSDQGGDYLFRDAIEVLTEPRVLGAIGIGLPTQGDSGAWLATEESSPIWAAMLFGEDGTRGFAIRASWIQQWAERRTGHTLSP